jgi:hypothetical protein
MDKTLHDRLTTWRRHLHAHPGLTLDEAETAAFVIERLRELGITEIETGIGGHGVVPRCPCRRATAAWACAPTWTPCRSRRPTRPCRIAAPCRA